MNADPRIQLLLDKQEIHELALLYCRGVDRKDPELLRSLYTADAFDNHGTVFRGPADQYVAFLEQVFDIIEIGAHYVTNHLVHVDGDTAQGEVYALGYHIFAGPEGTSTESFVGVRYLDRYRREAGQWRIELREVLFDLDRTRPIEHRGATHGQPDQDPSYQLLDAAMFARRGPRRS